MELNVLWFVLITVLFVGFFFLEGFDYGVGMLLPFISDRDDDRRMVLKTIAPVWDGNEVWMITAGGALFAAFPHVYATMFSTFYLALFLMLLALIMRGVAFELRSRLESVVWRSFWDRAICFGSAVPAFLWGVAVMNLIGGLPINERMIYEGNFFGLLGIYPIIGGLTFLFVFAFHGAAFLSFRINYEPLVLRIRQMALPLGGAATMLFVICLGLTYTETDLFNSTPAVAALLAAALVFVLGYLMLTFYAFKLSFVLSSLAIAFTTAGFFAGLFPRIMVSSLAPDWSLTIYNAASTPYTLQIMTVAALVLVPVVLIYQIGTYWVFRRRITPADLEQEH